MAFGMSTGIIFASIALYKIRTFQVSDLDNEYSGQNYIAFRIITIVSAAVFCLMYLTLATNDSTYLSASLLYLLFKADECFSDVLYGIEQRNERMDYIGKSQIIRGIVSLGGFSIPLALTGNLHMALVCMTVCCMLVTLLYDLGHAHLFGPVRPHIALPKAYSLARACFLAMVASLLANSIVSVVRQYFGIAHGDEALGIYASVATPAVLVQVAANYLYSPMVGELSRSWKHDHAATFRKKFLKVLSLILLVVGTLIAVLSPFGGALLEIVYGESIAPHTYLFPFVLIATGAIGVLFYVNDVLVILRRTRVMLICNAFALVASIASAYALIPQVGMNGINFAIMLAATLGSLAGSFVILRSSNHR
ncbi:lipopolysaccharide biosynthesis protein [Rubneribacter sp.]